MASIEVAQIKPDIRRDLIVARSRGMQALAGITDQCGKTFLDIEMHVFQFRPPDKLAAANFVTDLAQAMPDGGQIICIDNTYGGKHLCVSKGAFNVVIRQSPVKIQPMRYNAAPARKPAR